ncbi:hypothetical protein ILYODFUR_013917 [Ilyodon furcidens]|uniref:Uncharacterized protein n=1 Tax=Ilyodon furcidens TaxID=33524 RepID=A0ABV0UG12_9TELE
MYNCKEFRDFLVNSPSFHQRFRESGEISACKQQGRKPTLNALDYLSLCSRYYGLRNTSENQSFNTVCRYIYKFKLKLYHAKRKPYINNRNVASFSGTELI